MATESFRSIQFIPETVLVMEPIRIGKRTLVLENREFFLVDKRGRRESVRLSTVNFSPVVCRQVGDKTFAHRLPRNFDRRLITRIQNQDLHPSGNKRIPWADGTEA